MALINRKPYCWIDNTVSPPQMWVLCALEAGKDIVAYEEAEHDNVLDLKLYIRTGDAPEIPTCYVLHTFNPAVHHKVTVSMYDERGSFTGLHTVDMLDGVFSFGSAPTVVPYIWLSVPSTAQPTIHLAANTGPGYKFSTVTVNFIPARLECNVKVVIDSDPTATASIIDNSIRLWEFEGFDPACDDIKVELWMPNPKTGVSERKGKGTTHGSEGDASSEG